MAVLDLPYCVYCGNMTYSLGIENNLHKFYCRCGEFVEVEHSEELLPDSGVS